MNTNNMSGLFLDGSKFSDQDRSTFSYYQPPPPSQLLLQQQLLPQQLQQQHHHHHQQQLQQQQQQQQQMTPFDSMVDMTLLQLEIPNQSLISDEFQKQIQVQVEIQQQQLQQQYQMLQISLSLPPQISEDSANEYQLTNPFLMYQGISMDLSGSQSSLHDSNDSFYYPNSMGSRSTLNSEYLYMDADQDTKSYPSSATSLQFSGQVRSPSLPNQQFSNLTFSEPKFDLTSPPLAPTQNQLVRLHSDPIAHLANEDTIDLNFQSSRSMSVLLLPSKKLKKKLSSVRLSGRSLSAVSQKHCINEKYNSQPGPIPASAPIVEVDHDTGEEYLTFSYSSKRVVTKFSLRCTNIDSTLVLDYDDKFLRENCVYPGAMCPPEEYQGKRGNYERECNIIGWKLSALNPEISGRRGLIQRAVDSWRNTRSDVQIRSRRVRKENRLKRSKEITA